MALIVYTSLIAWFKKGKYQRLRSVNKCVPYLKATMVLREGHFHRGRENQPWNNAGSRAAATARPAHRLELQQPPIGRSSNRCSHAS